MNPPNIRLPTVDDLEALAERLDSRGYASSRLEALVFPDETHNSVVRAACRGCFDLSDYGRLI